jgi:hypothetical protein
MGTIILILSIIFLVLDIPTFIVTLSQYLGLQYLVSYHPSEAPSGAYMASIVNILMLDITILVLCIFGLLIGFYLRKM